MNAAPDHAVVIAGGGPTGMMLAAELTVAGADTVVLERRERQELDGSRAGGLHTRTMEVLDQRGVVERFLAEGQAHPAAGYAQIPLDIGDLPSRHNCVLALWQSDFERILAGWLDELGVTVLRGREVAGFAQDDGGIEVHTSDGASIRASFLVGCDGGRSVVRKAAGIDFPGLDPSISFILAEVATVEEPGVGMRPEGGGIGPIGGGRYRMVLKEERADDAGEPTLEDLRAVLVRTFGTDYGVHDPTWVTRFTDMTRQAASYRRGRVLLAGDAAHIHSPAGGQGLNTGVQDAVNLGWKLALVVRRCAPDALLDTYHAERHPVGARVQRNTMAQTALNHPDERRQALRDTVAELLGMDEPRRRLAAEITGLDIRYDLGEGHPVLGRRMPDLDLDTAEGPTRVYALLYDGRGLLLDLDGCSAPDLVPWADRVRHVRARAADTWELPLIGEVAAPPAVLVRPDGHVAWTGDPTDPGLPLAVTTWFGAPSS